VTDLALDTAHGAVPTRLYKPSSQENLPVLLYYGAYGLKDSASLRLYGWVDLDGLGDEDRATYQMAVYHGVLHSFLHYSALEPRAMQALEDGATFLKSSV
jgi:acetyl esterase/lipase